MALGARVPVPVPAALGSVPLTGQSLAVLVSAAQLVGAALVLACGWARLGMLRGFGEAYALGVAPYLSGALAKAALGAAVACAWGALRAGRRARVPVA